MECKNELFGLVFSIVVGGIVTPLFLFSLRCLIGLGTKEKKNIKRVPPWLTGFIERLFFTLVVGYNLNGAATAMIAWLALKFATNWNRNIDETDHKNQSFPFTALLAGLVSMLFAMIGGLIMGGKIFKNIF